MTEQRQIPPFIQTFVKALEKLDGEERARFKRNAGNTLEESRDVLGLFYRKLLHNRELSEQAENIYFLIATLYPFEKPPRQKSDEGQEQSAPPPPSLGASLQTVRTEKNGEGLDRRVERLLDADEQQLPFYLRREIHFLTNEGKRLNWAYLLHDILQWQHPDHWVQRKWAKDYFATQVETESTNTP